MDKSPNIYEFTAYRDYLKRYYAFNKKRTRYFSYRYFSEKAGFSSHSVLRMIIGGQRNLAYDSIEKVCRALGLDGKKSGYFRLMVLFEQTASLTEKNCLLKEMMRLRPQSKRKRIEKRQYAMYSEWYIPVVRELITLPDFRDDPSWIAKKLSPKITVPQATKALKVLSGLGLIVKNEKGCWMQQDPVISTDAEVNSLAMRNYARAMIMMAHGKVETVPPEDREVSGMTLGITRDTYHQIKQRIRQFKEEILMLIENDAKPSQEVCRLNMQLFPLTGPAKKEPAA